MKYKVGDKVRIKSLDWYKANKDEDGIVEFEFHIFVPGMSKFCGKVLTVADVYTNFYGCETYSMREDDYEWGWGVDTIEGLVEETNIDLTVKGEEIKERIEITIPEGYEYVIESGKIIFTKKKKEYPKTYEECENILGLEDSIIEGCLGYEYKLLNAFQKLLMCRDAYWKIAGEELGLGKPWENSRYEVVYGICRDEGIVVKGDDYWGDKHVFEFPIREMRDAFYEAFKELIEKCKEFL